MKKSALILLLLLGLQTARAQKYMAITVDDLPFVGADQPDKMSTATARLLKTFRQYGITAVGFVNEGRDKDNVGIRKKLLEEWLKAGHELGNHTWSHPSLTNVTLEEYQEEIMKGEKVSRGLSRHYGKPYRYFRHPYLHTGNDSLKKYGLEKFLAEKGYTPVPVTMEADDWYYNQAYIKAGRLGDTALQNYVAREYVKHTLDFIRYYEKLTLEVAGEPARQIFLIHANELNSLYFSEVLSELKSQGYRFLTVEEALRDNIYRMPENVLTEKGFSWLHRWRITAGKKTDLKEPEIAAAVRGAYEK